MVSITPDSLTAIHKPPLLTRARRRKLIENLLDGKTQRRSGIEAGYSPKSVDAQVSMALKTPEVQETFRQIMQRVGLTDEYLAHKVRSLVDAKETKFFQHEGHVTEMIEVDALETQRKTLELATKLAGHLKDKTEVDIRMGIMAMVVDAMKPQAQ